MALTKTKAQEGHLIVSFLEHYGEEVLKKKKKYKVNNYDYNLSSNILDK